MRENFGRDKKRREEAKKKKREEKRLKKLNKKEGLDAAENGDIQTPTEL